MPTPKRFIHPRCLRAALTLCAMLACGCVQTEAWRQAKLRDVPPQLVRLTMHGEGRIWRSNGFVWRGLVVTTGHTGKAISVAGNVTITRGDEVYEMADMHASKEDDWCIIAPTVLIDGGLEIDFDSPKGYKYAVAYRGDDVIITPACVTEWPATQPAEGGRENVAGASSTPVNSLGIEPYGWHFPIRSVELLGPGCSGSVLVAFASDRAEVCGMLIFGVTADRHYHGYLPFCAVKDEFLKAAAALRKNWPASQGS